ncbi:peptidase S10 [Algoriphagus marincola]|uniref:Peptidase S10 n=1 Tax=Algoriphagus marincola TaxID=264027 RepID=A0ABS7N7H6_9BACT|nr:peptidase S10 [Algoriphagus marincola]MBY5951906.1 peptidase S10 [Algoriphagus marincola]
MQKISSILLVVFLFTYQSSFAQESDTASHSPRQFVKSHTGVFDGQRISYQSIVKETFLKNSKGEVTASLWSTSYIKEGADQNRPVIFIFNGGPGSASIWLHMGFFGPKVVQVDSEAKADDGAAPYLVESNSMALLDLADLVFLDPIGTGFSRVTEKGKVEDYWGLVEDAQSVADFIRIWIRENNRWQAPKFLAGESFGTTRAAKVAEVLEGDGQHVALNGLILISQALDYAGSSSWPDNLTSFFTYLPSMAVTARYHGKAGEGKSIEEFAKEARDFAYQEYLPALFEGQNLSKERKEEIAEKLSYFTGLDQKYILRSDNQILMHRFKKELLREDGKAIGTLDGRFAAVETDQVAEGPVLGDPSDYMTEGAYTAAFNSYLLNELGVEMEIPYLSSNGEIGGKWRWRPVPDGSYWEPSYVSTARALSEVMHRNTKMRVMVANGYYDLITPFFDAEFTFARHDFPQDRIEMKYYEAGHMMYNRREDFEALAKDIRAFVEEVLAN